MESGILNLLLLPLLGGYVFCSRCHWTWFATKRADGQRLIYSSSVAGIILLLAARFLELMARELAADPALAETFLVRAIFFSGVTFTGSGSLLLILGFAPGSMFLKSHCKAAKAFGSALFVAGLVALIVAHPITALGAVSAPVLVFFYSWLMLYLARGVARTTRTVLDLQAPTRVMIMFPGIAVVLAAISAWGPALPARWQQFSNIPYSGLALLAGLLGATMWAPTNTLFTRLWAWRRTHEQGLTTSLERLLFRAFRERMPIQITLKDGKVYTGFMHEMPPPITHMEGSCIEFVPFNSGYRDPVTKEVKTTTNYIKVIKHLSRVPKDALTDPENMAELAETVNERLKRLLKAVPLCEVLIASMYDPKYGTSEFAMPAPSPSNSKSSPSSPPALPAPASSPVT